MSSDTIPLVHYVVYIPTDRLAAAHSCCVPQNASVYELEQAIRDHPSLKYDLEHKALSLFKCGTLPVHPPSLDSRFDLVIGWLCEHGEGAVMDTMETLKYYFPDGPTSQLNKKLDVIAVTDSIANDFLEPTASSQNSAWDQVIPITGSTCPRVTTVSGIWDRLMKYRFIWARGTPASGKSTLARLLCRHANTVSPDATVILLRSWPTQDRLFNMSMTWDKYLMSCGWKGTKAPAMTIFIFDEAQMTYGDFELWNEFFKSLRDYNSVYVIGFASYGSAMSRFDFGCGTPLAIAPMQRVTLRPIDYNDGCPAVGILFTKEDFDDTVVRKYKDEGGHYFDKSFLDGLFEVTGGHIGAIVDILQIIEASDTYRTIKHSASPSRFSWDTFRGNFPPQLLVEQINLPTTILRKGLPHDEDLKKVEISRTLSIVAQRTVVKANEVPEVTKDCLEFCTRHGWLHTDILDSRSETIGYFFASSLHQWYVEWKLSAMETWYEPNEVDLKRFALAVIEMFNPQVLQKKQRIGPAGIQRPPEAQFQDEFYRSSHEYRCGALVTFPEFGTAKGQVDFYVPSKKWGIELLRDSDGLEQHSGRFSKSGTYRGIVPVEDYVILDFRTTVPQSEHPGIENLYHIVFKNNYEEVTVLDNKNQMVKEFRLIRK